ncbi:mitochondrial thiamine pyrophosphate carrier-like [Homarus americanus]|uniref:Mitochondrial thiamine pyrophosphate carrier-like n=1 Tax=Homarus americanus TaxID=6706 RepID=A0A8J5JRD4_HOMAM|nr:mitochondrial thiamine pyrophosphate carrier-like [Homarus americanus]XP_042242175.1 mitochondrial thiamine pyrophosphate carrier-like [Homarus americanus]KAG7157824.1 Mitochondrial thiamine pyrophosphate carrier-like [Homarus americanus]
MVSYVGHKSDNQGHLTAKDHAVAGAVSGFLTRGFLQPLDVLKIRFQLQVEPTAKRGGGLYHGVLQSAAKIVHNEGLAALWKGHVPAQALSITFGMAQFWSYEVLTKTADNHGLAERYITHGLCGALAGTCGTLASFPCDVVRTRLIAQGHPKHYNGMMDAWGKMLRQEGVLSLWRGIIPTLAMTAPYTGLTFFFYNALFSLMSQSIREESELPWLGFSAISGTAAGVCAKLAVYPLDVLKKRIQIRGFEEARRQFGKVVVYPSAWACIVRISQEEGILAWYKGLWPAMLKSGCASGSIFITFEVTCRALSHIHSNEKDSDVR